MPFESPDIAYGAIVLGFLLGYWELVRPGTVLPGVAGAVLVMLGAASFAGRVQWLGAGLCLLSGLLVLADAHYRMRGAVAVAAGVILALGARHLSIPAVGWGTSWVLSVPFVWVSNWLLTIALQARANKLSP